MDWVTTTGASEPTELLDVVSARVPCSSLEAQKAEEPIYVDAPAKKTFKSAGR